MSIPRIRMLPCPGMFVSTVASTTGTATPTSGTDCTRSRIDSSKPNSPAETCNCVVPAMRSMVVSNARKIDRLAVCIATKTPTPRTMPATVRIHRSRCRRRYGQLSKRSSIIAAGPPQCGRRAKRQYASTVPPLPSHVSRLRSSSRAVREGHR